MTHWPSGRSLAAADSADMTAVGNRSPRGADIGWRLGRGCLRGAAWPRGRAVQAAGDAPPHGEIVVDAELVEHPRHDVTDDVIYRLRGVVERRYGGHQARSHFAELQHIPPADRPERDLPVHDHQPAALL